jgi:hypothetical protein
MEKALLYYSIVLYLSLQETVSLLGFVNSTNSYINLKNVKTNTATYSVVLLYIAFFFFFFFLGMDASNIQESNSLILELPSNII